LPPVCFPSAISALPSAGRHARVATVAVLALALGAVAVGAFLRARLGEAPSVTGARSALLWPACFLGLHLLVWGALAGVSGRWYPVSAPRALALPGAVAAVLALANAGGTRLSDTGIVVAGAAPTSDPGLLARLATPPAAPFVAGACLAVASVGWCGRDRAWTLAGLGLTGAATVAMAHRVGGPLEVVGPQAAILVLLAGVLPWTFGYVAGDYRA
jgi:hypothetical protein